MTKHLHRDEDLVLNDYSLKSIYNLSLQSKKVCISGEGDPLASWKNLYKILENSPKETHFELITSAYWNKSKTEVLLNEISQICESSNSTLGYRISIDQFHELEIKRDVLRILIDIFQSNKFKNITLQIRSITGQEKYLFRRLKDTLTITNIAYKIVQINEIEYELQSDKFTIKIQFKPTVNPIEFNYIDSWTIDKYISFLEESRNSYFHIGLLNSSIINPMFDITINPNGDIVLYGLEPYVLGNITQEVFDYELIKQKVFENDNLKDIITIRFIDIINNWRRDKNKVKLIQEVNNPFWIVRNLYNRKLLDL